MGLLIGTAPVLFVLGEEPLDAVRLEISDPVQYPMSTEMIRAQELIARYQHLEALAVLREIIRKHDDHAPARFLAASALMRLHRYDGARVLLEHMLEKDPQNVGALNNLAWMYATAEDPAFRKPALAAELARRALLRNPIDFHVWSTMAEAHFANRDYARAERAAREALSLARDRNAPAPQVFTYEEQVRKCTEAVRAFSIID